MYVYTYICIYIYYIDSEFQSTKSWGMSSGMLFEGGSY